MHAYVPKKTWRADGAKTETGKDRNRYVRLEVLLRECTADVRGRREESKEVQEDASATDWFTLRCSSQSLPALL